MSKFSEEEQTAIWQMYDDSRPLFEKQVDGAKPDRLNEIREQLEDVTLTAIKAGNLEVKLELPDMTIAEFSAFMMQATDHSFQEGQKQGELQALINMAMDVLKSQHEHHEHGESQPHTHGN